MPPFAIGLIVLHVAAVVAAVISAYLPDRKDEVGCDTAEAGDEA